LTTAGTTRVYGRSEVSLPAEARYGCAVQSWDITTIEAPGGTVDPTVLTTDDGTRAIAIRLEAGQAMNDHQVRERAWVVVVQGRAQIRSGDEVVDGGVGTVVTFEPGERHAVSSEGGARLLLILAPWPGPGHYLDGETPS
jgi:mannose-6-phosphate isomerase-like protein (cupin superfamily)